MEKKRIVIEIEEEDYKALCTVKALAGLEWKDLLIAGALYIYEFSDLEEKLNEVKTKLKKGGGSYDDQN